MNPILYLLVFLFLIAVTIAAGVYTIRSALAITQNPNYGTDSSLQASHKYLTIASTVCFVTTAIIIVLVVLYFVFGSETILITGPYVVLGLLFLAAVLCLTIGVLAIIAAQDMKNSSNFTNMGQDHTAYVDAIIAAVLGVSGVGVIVIGFIGYYIYVAERNRQIAERRREINEAVTKIKTLQVNEAISQRQADIAENRAQTSTFENEINTNNGGNGGGGVMTVTRRTNIPVKRTLPPLPPVPVRRTTVQTMTFPTVPTASPVSFPPAPTTAPVAFPSVPTTSPISVPISH